MRLAHLEAAVSRATIERDRAHFRALALGDQLAILPLTDLPRRFRAALIRVCCTTRDLDVAMARRRRWIYALRHVRVRT